MEHIRSMVTEYKDFPKPGVVFKDISPVLLDFQAFNEVLIHMNRAAEKFEGCPDKVIGIESRGFFFGPTLALSLECGFVPARKIGKLPSKTHKAAYDLEYGSAEIEIQSDAILEGESVVIVDDVLATGGTALAAAHLVEKAGGKVAGIVVFAEIEGLNGRKKLKGYAVESLVKF